MEILMGGGVALGGITDGLTNRYPVKDAGNPERYDSYRKRLQNNLETKRTSVLECSVTLGQSISKL